MLEPANDMPESTCRSCKFYKLNATKVGEGECRRMPPAVNLLISQRGVLVKSDYPPVAASEWCGEFKPKLQA